MSALPGFDPGTLSWVRDEIDLALAQAGEALARHAATPGEAKPLAEARNFLHQARGALTVAGLPGVSFFAESIDTCLNSLPHGTVKNISNDTKSAVIAIDAAAGSAIAALRRYLDELMGGQPDQPLRLLPAYRAMLQATGQPEPPGALFMPDLSLRPPHREMTATPLAQPRARALRMGFARGRAKWSASDERGLKEMRNAVASVEQSLAQPHERALWWVALAWLDTLTAGQGETDSADILAGLEGELELFVGLLENGTHLNPTPPAALLTRLLQGIAFAPPGDDLREGVRSTYRLAALIPVDSADTLALATHRAACRAPLATAMQEWEKFSQGAAIALLHFHDVSRLLAASASASNDADLARIAAAVATFAAWLRQQPESADDSVTLEIAAALILIEAAVEQEGLRSAGDAALFAQAVTTHIERLEIIKTNGVAALPPLRPQRWHERQLIAQVGREILANIEALEPRLDVLLAAPEPDEAASNEATSLAAAQAAVHQIVGAFSLLGENRAAAVATAVEASLAGRPADLADQLAALGEFAASLTRNRPEPGLLDHPPAATTEVTAVAAATVLPAPTVAPRPVDEIDPQLVTLFFEEADEQLLQLEQELHAWRAAPQSKATGQRLARLLHTFKGGARMCGAMTIGELAHSMETRIEEALRADAASAAMLDSLESSLEHANRLTARLHAHVAGEPAEAVVLRVRADLIDQLVNDAGEIAIARSRIEGELKQIKRALGDLTDNVTRLRGQLREFEIHAETRIQSRHGSLGNLGTPGNIGPDSSTFDPLELDRFTRLQELTRMMAESVNDVATVQHALYRHVDDAGEALASQSRQNRELSHALLQARMVPFATVAERLHHIVRKTARELGRHASLDIRGATSAVDRSVLERMLAPLEHLLRNAVAHGIETPERRQALNKPALGQIVLTIAPGNHDITLTLADDGSGLDYAAIRQRAIAQGLLGSDEVIDNAVLGEMIFRSGFTTATHVNAVAGRGVGLDVVHDEVTQLGGRVAVRSDPQTGTCFEIVLPLSLAVIPVMLVRAGGQSWAIPAALVEEATELEANETAARRAAGGLTRNGRYYAWHRLTELYDLPEPDETACQLLLRSGGEQIALEVSALRQNLEVVVKPVGDLLARVPGLIAATVLPEGAVALIINPVTLARRPRPVFAPLATRTKLVTPADPTVPPAPTFAIPVMVIDDSLTVRKITSRLLERAGYRVLLAKNGLDALEQLDSLSDGRLPQALLVDIEMPRMDGFELARALRNAPRLAALPIIMISSRTADKHRQVARELGVRHYLGKPYDEETLLALIAELVKPA